MADDDVSVAVVSDALEPGIEVSGLTENMGRASLALARRFDAGATMWCASPSWPFHAAHVSVEFVHPVIVGKRALPAVLVADREDLVKTLRGLVRPGDIVCALGPADDAQVAAALQRGPAWGVETVWIGAGVERPAPGAADHLLWMGTEAPLDASEEFVRVYHLLWELTHVCFEHPGLLKAPAEACTDEVCVTCSDEGRVAEVVRVDDDQAVVLAEGRREVIDVSLIDPPAPGDLVLVHAGFAIHQGAAS